MPPIGAGTSIVALSDSSVTSESSVFTMSPGLTNTSMTGTSLKSPMSGTRTSIVAPAGGVALAPSPGESARPFSPRGAGVTSSGAGGGVAVAARVEPCAPSPPFALGAVFAPDSSVSTREPSLTLSPTFTATFAILPAAGDGTSIVALSDSIVTSESSTPISSPGFTNTSMIGTSLKSPMSGTLTSIVLIGRNLVVVRNAASSSNGPGRGLRRIDRVFLHGLGDLRRRHRALVGERLQRRDGDVVAIDLEEAAQLLARVRPSVAVRAEHDVAARNVR